MALKKSKKKVDPVQKSVLQLFADWMATSGNGQMFQVNHTEAAFVIKVMTQDEMKIMQKTKDGWDKQAEDQMKGIKKK